VTHVVGQVLSDAARGRFPEPDGAVEVVAPWKPGVAGVVALTGRAYVATTRDARDVLAEGPDDLSDHRRLRHARQVRDDVVVHGDDRGMITFGTGIGGLKEIGVEVPVRARNRGVDRALVADALGLVPAGQPMLGAVAPGNAASLRAFLAAGFQPVGAAHLVRPADG
jgi:hypothetical protein